MANLGPGSGAYGLVPRKRIRPFLFPDFEGLEVVRLHRPLVLEDGLFDPGRRRSLLLEPELHGSDLIARTLQLALDRSPLSVSDPASENKPKESLKG